MKTLLQYKGTSGAYILKVFGPGGAVYNYGVFASRVDAIEFATKECGGFRYAAEHLIMVERD